jgi:hypothetical protein
MLLYVAVKKIAPGIEINYPGSLCPNGPTYSTGVVATM